jgi:uncharacterized membrane protein (UPF0182 family)
MAQVTPMVPRKRPANRRVVGIIIVLAVVFFLTTLVPGLARLYAEWLWFQDMGHTVVFWAPIVSALTVGVAFGAIYFVFVYANLLIARTMAPRADEALADTAVPEQWAEVLLRIRAAVDPWIGWALLGVALFVAWGAGAAMAAEWPSFMELVNAAPTAVKDPQFKRDVSFYMLQLPAWRTIVNWAIGMVVTTTIAVVAFDVLAGAIRPWDRLKGFAPHVKAHISLLIGLGVLLQIGNYWLDTFELVFSERGQVVGATYTDINASLPALYILMAVALVSGIVLLVNIRFQGWRLFGIALGIWFGASILVGVVYPAIVQAFVVAPNEISLERPYIKRNIDMTRLAFGLDAVEPRPFPADETLDAAGLVANKDTLDNVRLWDPAVTVQAFRQLQEIRPYYDFKDADIDRYTLGAGGMSTPLDTTAAPGPGAADKRTRREQVLISGRELNTDQLADRAKTWINQHLVYTHGYGAVVSPVNQTTSQGLPKFLVQDIPPRSTEISIALPGIYFGEESNRYAVVNTGLDEFDYPQGDGNATTRFAGRSGVPLGGLLGRVTFALYTGDWDFVFSRYLKDDSRVLYYRDITQRVRRIAPWLRTDDDPYLAVIKGRLVWIVDGYTTSTRYPYSQPLAFSDAQLNGLNYARNAVKATVDAYSGETTLYAFDPSDPILRTWMRILPGTVNDVREMPREVRAHLRYPEGLFLAQAEVFKTYHMTAPTTFYNREDQWELPGERAGRPMNPFYILMRLPGEKSEDFIMMVPFTPRGKDNMIGWMAAKSDPADYGRRVVYTFPKQRLTFGPEQVAARINQEPAISSQLTLLNQQGSRVQFGNLLVLPIKDSIVYIQPLYLQAEQSAIPELKRVVVAYADKIAMGPDLTTALTDVFGPGAAAAVPSGAGGTSAPATGGGSGETTATAGGGAGGGAATGGGRSADAKLAATLYRRAIAAQRAGDWAAYGAAISQLGTVLERLAGSTTTTGTTK